MDKEQEQAISDESPLARIIQKNLESHTGKQSFANTLLSTLETRLERNNRSRNALDNGLLSGSMSAEQANTKLEQLREERLEIDKDLLEVIQFSAQLDRDKLANYELFVDRIKKQGDLDYDFHKHFTTLGTGSLLFIAALARVIFPEIRTTEALPLLFGSFVLLAVSVISAAYAMRAITFTAVFGRSSKFVNRTSAFSMWSFSTGILVFVYYVGINMAGTKIENEWRLPAILVGMPLAILIFSYCLQKIKEHLKAKEA